MPIREPVSFVSLKRGTRVVDRFGRPVGEVHRVLTHGDGTFDGLVVQTRAGLRFVDAPEVRRLARGVVNLGSTIDEAECADPAQRGRGRARAASYGRDDLTEADRGAAIEALKRAYVRDEIDIDELAGRVATAHVAENLAELDSALSGLLVA